MPYSLHDPVFTTLAAFHASTRPSPDSRPKRLVHCINPFSAQPGTEHYRAQHVTLASMAQARDVAHLLRPDVEVVLAKATLGDDFESGSLEFDLHYTLERSVSDLGQFKKPRPLPLVMDVLTAAPVEPDDIFIFTNTDISLSSNFYVFIQSVFERGVDCAIINRRTISDCYADAHDLALMEVETGTKHPGFDCFAMRGALRDRLLPYDSCIGIGGVMLPLVHQLLALADRPVVLLDAHATFHLGDDQTWRTDDFSDYTEHNRSEIDRIFAALVSDPTQKETLVSRLAGAHETWVFKDHLKRMAGIQPVPTPKKQRRFAAKARAAVRSLFRA